MKQIEKLNRRLLCRDGPKLETCNCTPIVLCGSPIATATYSSSTVPFAANASEETVEHETAAKREESKENVRNGCSTGSIQNRTEQSSKLTLRRHDQFCKWPRQERRPQVRHGRNVMTGTWNIIRPEEDNDLSMIRYHDLGSPKQFSKDMFWTMTCQGGC